MAIYIYLQSLLALGAKTVLMSASLKRDSSVETLPDNMFCAVKFLKMIPSLPNFTMGKIRYFSI